MREESKYFSKEERICKSVFTLYRFNYLSLEWIDTTVNLNGFITQKLHRYQYLYIEESNKIMFLGLVQNPFDENRELQNTYKSTIDLLGAYCTQIGLGTERNHEYVPSFQVPKSRFSSVKVDSTVFVIGGHDDLKSCFQYNINLNKRISLKNTTCAWQEVPSLNIERYSASWCSLSHRFIYVFGGRSRYGTILNSIEVLDAQMCLSETARSNLKWRTIPLFLPINVYDSFSEQIDTWKIMILGGKIKSQRGNWIKAYLIDILASSKLEDFEYSLHELEDILSPENLKHLITSSLVTLSSNEAPDFTEIPPIINLSNK